MKTIESNVVKLQGDSSTKLKKDNRIESVKKFENLTKLETETKRKCEEIINVMTTDYFRMICENSHISSTSPINVNRNEISETKKRRCR